MERELTKEIPLAVVVKLDAVSTGLEELYRAGYDVVIVDSSLPSDRLEAFLKTARQIDPELGLVVLVESNAGEDRVDHIKRVADLYIMRQDNFHLRLPEAIHQLGLRKFAPAASDADDLLPDVHAKSTVINLIVNTLAHEINNPLMTILGTSELLLMTGNRLGTAESEKIQMIQESARRIQLILKDLSKIRRPSLRETDSGILIDSRDLQMPVLMAE